MENRPGDTPENPLNVDRLLDALEEPSPMGFLVLRLSDGEMDWMQTHPTFEDATQSAEEEADGDQDNDAVYVVVPVLAAFPAKG